MSTWSTTLYGLVDELDHPQLVQHVLDVAGVVNTGRANDSQVDELVVAARVLSVRYRRGQDKAPLRPVDPRLPGEYGPMVPSRQARDRMAEVMNAVSFDGPTCGFVSAKAGQIRAVFGSSPDSVADELAGHCLATLPRQLPAGELDLVVLYATGKTTVYGLLSAVRDGVDPAKDVKLVLDRLVGKEAFPWEGDPYSSRWKD